VRLRSPFNGEVIPFEFVAGQVPTLETMLAAQFVRVDDDPVKPSKPPKETTHGPTEAR
jgi:hypothetical protein